MAYLVFIAIMSALSLWSLYITRKEKRSFRSWGSEKLLQLRLKRGWFHASVDSRQFLREQAVKNEEPYSVPSPLKLLAVVEQREVAGMDCIILRERQTNSKKRILYLHGGAYVEQPILPHWLFLDRINNQMKGTIIVPLYPKAPVHTFTETFDPLVEIYRTMLEEVEANDLVVMGDSAGGGLALALTQQLASLGEPLPKEVILISPWLDITLRNASIDAIESKDPMLSRRHLQEMGKAWVGDGDPNDWRVSPINGKLQGLPPLSLFVGTHEMFLSDAQKLQMLCTRQGTMLELYIYPKMNHDFPLFPIPEAKRAQREIIDIIQR